jgi:trimeric autotransporter adhesin
VDADGNLGTSNSSARFKDNIIPMDNVSEVILALKPVTFRYKKEFNPNGILQFGLIAEEVEKVDPDLMARDARDDEIYTVRYNAVKAMLLKEHRKLEEQAAIMTQLREDIRANV